jgi:hypothetical protein
MSHFLSSLYLGRTPPAVASRRRRLLTVLAASMLALALLAGIAPLAQAQDPVTVRLEPAAASGDVGDVFTIQVYVDNVPSTGVQGWQVSINFDPAVLQLNPGQIASTYFAGNLYSTGGYTTIDIVNVASDKITLGQAMQGIPSSYPSGSNLLLATIEWKGVGVGASALDTNTSRIMKDALGGIVYSPVTELDGQITVASNPYDVNDDGEVDVLDIILTAQNWLATDPALLAIYDFNDNDVVDVGDIMLVAANLTG